MAGRVAAVMRGTFARAGLAAIAIAWMLGACADGEGSPELAAQASYDLATDERFAVLLAGCEQNVYYDVETADVCAILVSTLVRGQRDPLKFAKPELAFGPRECREEVRRIAERYWELPGGEAYVRNALDVGLLAEDDVLLGILRRSLAHPIESLRTLGLQGISRHGGPEDWDAVISVIAIAERAELERALITLHDIDPLRAEAEFATWLRENTLAEYWQLLASRFARATSSAFIETAYELVEELPREIAPYLWVALANAGIEGAVERVDELSHTSHPDIRSQTVLALAAGKRYEQLGAMMLGDEEARIRIAAASALTDVEPGEPYIGWFRQALDDRDRSVRSIAMRKLVEWGDEEARAAALHRLGSNETGVREAGFGALRSSLAEDPEFTRAAFDQLLTVFEPNAHLPIEDNLSVLKLIGSVPDPRAAELLLNLARSAEGEIQAVSTYRWLVRAASNGGDAAQEALARELGQETDLERRLDLLEALSGHDGDVARRALLEFVRDESEEPLLVLYAAERLARIGPARDVLPVLKRVFLSSSDERVRRGLQCLLWHWYPRPIAAGG